MFGYPFKAIFSTCAKRAPPFFDLSSVGHSSQIPSSEEFIPLDPNEANSRLGVSKVSFPSSPQRILLPRLSYCQGLFPSPYLRGRGRWVWRYVQGAHLSFSFFANARMTDFLPFLPHCLFWTKCSSSHPDSLPPRSILAGGGPFGFAASLRNRSRVENPFFSL